MLAKGKLTRDCSDGAEAYALARDGALTGLSVGYITRKAGRQGDARVLQELELHEASLVPVPMNSKARLITVKSIASIRDLEELLRAGGLSGRKSRAAANAAWPTINNDNPTTDDELAAILSGSLSRIHTI
ncbi:HK97 family phage prohead protease [Croceicoccus marinus]|uniref:HK97 family phage prohead protease n=1 Tax=Croceicoccus marinus TaxID=450378 RepID=A0A7G6VRU2_9SPHN|nr:HK97 family phage prohead protease [Croceicoccus marinus]